MTYKEQYPEFIQETMFDEHGTRVLITDRAADVYLEQARNNKLKQLRRQSPQWFDDNQSQ